jgi:hypothetical protein
MRDGRAIPLHPFVTEDDQEIRRAVDVDSEVEAAEAGECPGGRES